MGGVIKDEEALEKERNEEELKNDVKKEEELLEKIKKFRDERVWPTKKTRMESEARMNKNHLFSQIIVNYYTLVVLSFSIWSLVINDPIMLGRISLLTVISSVILFGVSLFVSTFGFKEKAISYKQCYLDLYKIENDLDILFLDNKLDYSEKLDRFNAIKKEYNHILEKTDNHSAVDRLVFKKNQKQLNSVEDYLAYIKYRFLNTLTKILLVIFPIILFVTFLNVGRE